MTWIAVAVAGATLIGGVAGSAISSSGATSAANTQADAARDANATQLQMYEQSRADLEPYRGYGRTALMNLERLANDGLTMDPYSPTAPYDPSANAYTPTAPYDPSANAYTPTPVYRGPSEAEVRADPGYEFRVSEGQKALERAAAGKGLLLSGGQLKDLTRFGQGQGAQEYGAAYARGYALNQDLYGRTLAANQLDYGRGLQQNQDLYGRTLASNQLDYGRSYQANADLYNRGLQAYQTRYNTLLGLRKERYGEFAGIAGAGQGAVNTLSSIGARTGEQLGANTIGAGNAQASGIVGGANAVNAGLSSVGQAGNQYLNYQLLSSLANRNAYNPNVATPEEAALTIQGFRNAANSGYTTER